MPFRMVSSYTLKMVAKKKTTALLLLDKHHINSLDLRMKILGKIFLTRDQVDHLFTTRDLSDEDKPDKWDWDLLDHIVDVPYGGLCAYTLKGFSVNWRESKWLREACQLLGLTYYDGGPGKNSGYRKCRLRVPEGYKFNPDKQVYKKTRCSSCGYSGTYEADKSMKLKYSDFETFRPHSQNARVQVPGSPLYYV